MAHTVSLPEELSTRHFVEFRSVDLVNASVLRGRVVTFDRTYDLYEGWFFERVARGALEVEDGMRLNVQHDRGRPLARLGGDLQLNVGALGIDAVADLSGTAAGREAYEAARSGLFTGWSVEMRVTGASWRDIGDDAVERLITRGRLVGLAVVDDPAYEDALIKRARAFRGGGGSVRRGYGFL